MEGAMGINIYDHEQRRKYVNVEEGERFLQAVSRLTDQKQRLFCRILFYTGCRISEALELTGERIEINDRVLRIRCLKKRDERVFRRIQLPTLFVQQLVAITPKTLNKPLFDFSRTTGWRVVKKVMDTADIRGPHACPKGLRHGFGLRCARANVPRDSIQKALGHSDVTTTSIYLQLFDDEEREFFARTWDTDD
jgi:integrase